LYLKRKFTYVNEMTTNFIYLYDLEKSVWAMGPVWINNLFTTYNTNIYIALKIQDNN